MSDEVDEVRAAIRAQALDRFTSEHLTEDARDWLSGFAARAAVEVMDKRTADLAAKVVAVEALCDEWELLSKPPWWNAAIALRAALRGDQS